MQRRGFRPHRTVKGPKVDFVLGRCPFEDVATTNPAAVCQLHLGLAEGLAQGLGGLEVEDLVIKNPRRAGCRVALRQRPDLPPR
jgi:predicted ArsR family transcriptional regulator